MDMYITRLFLYSVSFVLIISLSLIPSDYYGPTVCWMESLLKTLKRKYMKSGEDIRQTTPTSLSDLFREIRQVYTAMPGIPDFRLNPQQTTTTSSNSNYTPVLEWVNPPHYRQDSEPLTPSLREASKAKGYVRGQREPGQVKR